MSISSVGASATDPSLIQSLLQQIAAQTQFNQAAFPGSAPSPATSSSPSSSAGAVSAGHVADPAPQNPAVAAFVTDPAAISGNTATFTMPLLFGGTTPPANPGATGTATSGSGVGAVSDPVDNNWTKAPPTLRGHNHGDNDPSATAATSGLNTLASDPPLWSKAPPTIGGHHHHSHGSNDASGTSTAQGQLSLGTEPPTTNTPPPPTVNVTAALTAWMQAANAGSNVPTLQGNG